MASRSQAEPGLGSPLASAPPVIGRRRRTDWRGSPRSPADDTEWAARRAAVAVAAAALEAHSTGTAGHSDDVVLLCDTVASKLGVRGEERAHLLAAAQLHDIGKLAVPPEILEKPGPLTKPEWAEIHQHTITGEQILQSVPELGEVARIVRSSHERFDGQGYPDGLAGEDIPLASRVVFCADAFHAVRSDRPYRRGKPAAEALAEVRRNAGTQFDPTVADALVEAARDLKMAARKKRSGLAATAASRRLVAMLAALAVSGGALAATGNFDRLVPGGGGESKSAPPEPEVTPVAPSSTQQPTPVTRPKGHAGAKRTRRRPAVAPPVPTGESEAAPPTSGGGNGNGRGRVKGKRHAHAPAQPKPEPPKPKPETGQGAPAPPQPIAEDPEQGEGQHHQGEDEDGDDDDQGEDEDDDDQGGHEPEGHDKD